jgi:fructokinase
MQSHRIGIDLGGTKIEIAVLGPDGSERVRHRIDTPQGYQASP